MTLTAYNVLYTPVIAVTCLGTIFGTFNGNSIWDILEDISLLCYFSNNLVNPFIYYITLRDFRDGYRKLLFCCVRQPVKINPPIDVAVIWIKSQSTLLSIWIFYQHINVDIKVFSQMHVYQRLCSLWSRFNWNQCFVLEVRKFHNLATNTNKNRYRSGKVNSNTVNSKFHLIRSFFEIFARFLSFHV